MPLEEPVAVQITEWIEALSALAPHDVEANPDRDLEPLPLPAFVQHPRDSYVR